MSIKIGIGTNLHIAASGDIWTAYWASRTPTNLIVNYVSPTSLKLDWTNAGIGYDGTSIERSTNGVTYSEIATVASGIVTYTNSPITADTRYYYRVRCYKGTNYSPYSNIDDEWTMLPVLRDGNTMTWLDFTNLSTITKDGGNLVSRWNDKLGSGRDMFQITGSQQPLYSASGIAFDGVDNWMQSANWGLVQPEMFYIVGRQLSWSNGEYIFDGLTNDYGAIVQTNTTPRVYLYAGGVAATLTTWSLSNFAIIRACINGANSFIRKNGDAALTGNAGVRNMGGLTLARIATLAAAYGNIEFKEFILRKTADDAATQTLIVNYLNAKYTIY